jgi:hypothetical protein
MGETPDQQARQAYVDRIDTTVPHPARVYDYWLGGKDNFPADRAVGDEILKAMPLLPMMARAEREFLARVVRLAVGEGIRQFLDIGTGIPTANNTHEVAQTAAPEARIVYVDNDPIVLNHARALLRSTPEGATTYLDADLREPETILAGARDTLDFTQPICLMLLGVLEFVPDLRQATTAVHTLVDALPSGSLLVIASGLRDPGMDAAAATWNEGGGTPITMRTREELEGFFAGLEWLEPGLVSLPAWRPEAETEYKGEEIPQYGGVARKP